MITNISSHDRKQICKSLHLAWPLRWDEITYPFPNCSGCTVEVWERMSNFIPHLAHVGVWLLKLLCITGSRYASLCTERDRWTGNSYRLQLPHMGTNICCHVANTRKEGSTLPFSSASYVRLGYICSRSHRHCRCHESVRTGGVWRFAWQVESTTKQFVVHIWCYVLSRCAADASSILSLNAITVNLININGKVISIQIPWGWIIALTATYASDSLSSPVAFY